MTWQSPNKKLYPFPLFVYLLRRCNYQCSYCFTESGPQASVSSFILDTWHSLLAQASELGIPEIRLSGGEPFLYMDIARRCREIGENHMAYTITSNGSLIERNLDWLAMAPPKTLWLSFHPEHARSSHFTEKVALAARTLPLVGVNLFSRHLDHDPDLLSRCADAGAKRFKILHMTPIGRQHEDEPAAVWRPAQVQEVVANLDRFGGHALELRIEAPVLAESETGSVTCAIRSRPLLSIAPDGLVYPCCITLGIEGSEIGDLRSESLGAITSRSESSGTLPCDRVLPKIGAGAAACPLHLVKIRDPHFVSH